MDDEWKKNLSDNFSVIVNHVDDPDAIAEYLHYDCNPPVFTEENVQWMKSLTEPTKRKTRRLLNRLCYKPNYPLVALYNAFKETQNTVLRECLVKHVESYYAAQRKDMKIIPGNKLPLTESDWNEFHDSDVVKCQIDSDAFLRKFKDTDSNYIMTKEIRGRAVILNNSNFEKEKKKRCGSQKDVELLTKTLTQLHFNVEVYQDLNAEDMVKTLQNVSVSIAEKSDQCFILVVMSHGVITGVEGIDEKEVPFQEFARIFNPTNCPALKDKPKLFFFQSCRKEKGAHPLTCQKRLNGEENNKDFLFAYATTEGFESVRYRDTGSWFIQALCWVLKGEAHRLHLQEILTKVIAMVSGMEEDGKSCFFIPECRGSMGKNVHFFPGVCGEPGNPSENEKVGSWT